VEREGLKVKAFFGAYLSGNFNQHGVAAFPDLLCHRRRKAETLR
jgi:hypothetical protein